MRRESARGCRLQRTLERLLRLLLVQLLGVLHVLMPGGSMDRINLCRCTVVEQQRKRRTRNPRENQGHRQVWRLPKVAARTTGSPGPPHGEILIATTKREVQHLL